MPTSTLVQYLISRAEITAFEPAPSHRRVAPTAQPVPDPSRCPQRTHPSMLIAKRLAAPTLLIVTSRLRSPRTRRISVPIAPNPDPPIRIRSAQPAVFPKSALPILVLLRTPQRISQPLGFHRAPYPGRRRLLLSAARMALPTYARTHFITQTGDVCKTPHLNNPLHNN